MNFHPAKKRNHSAMVKGIVPGKRALSLCLPSTKKGLRNGQLMAKILKICDNCQPSGLSGDLLGTGGFLRLYEFRDRWTKLNILKFPPSKFQRSLTKNLSKVMVYSYQKRKVELVVRTRFYQSGVRHARLDKAKDLLLFRKFAVICPSFCWQIFQRSSESLGIIRPKICYFSKIRLLII